MLPITLSTPADSIHRWAGRNDGRITVSGFWILRLTTLSTSATAA